MLAVSHQRFVQHRCLRPEFSPDWSRVVSRPPSASRTGDQSVRLRAGLLGHPTGSKPPVLDNSSLGSPGYPHESTPAQWRWLESDCLHPSRRQSRGLAELVERPAVAQHLQDLRPGHGGPARGDGQRGRTLPRSLQKVVSGDGLRHAARHPTRVFRPPWIPGTAGTDTPAARNQRPPRLSAVRRPARQTLHPHLVGSGARFAGRTADRVGPCTKLLLRQRPQLDGGGVPAAVVRPRVRHQLRQQLLVLLPPGQRCGADVGHRHRDRDRAVE